MNKKLKIGIVVLLLGLIIGFIGIHFIAPYGILQPPVNLSDLTPEDLELVNSELKIPISQNEYIEGYWIKSNSDTAKGVIILVHGIGGNKESFLSLTKKLADQNVESIICDNRAHGKSGGKFCTYGYKEKNDIKLIVDHIKSIDPDLQIGIWGNSLGGAIAIQALEFDKRINFGIIESTFSDFRQIVFDYKKRILKGIGIKYVSDYAVDRAGQIANFNPNKIKPIESVKRIQQPVLIAHGNSDDNISFEYGKALYENLASKDKIFVEVEGGEHHGLFESGGKSYENKLMEFIRSNLK